MCDVRIAVALAALVMGAAWVALVVACVRGRLHSRRDDELRLARNAARPGSPGQPRPIRIG